MKTSYFDRKNLFLRVFAGFVLGTALGLLFPSFSLKIKFLGELYLNLIKLMVLPVVICSVFCSVTGMKDTAGLRKIGIRALLVFFLMFICCFFVSYVITAVIKPGAGLNLVSSSASFEQAGVSASSFFSQIVPSNIFSALSSGNILGVLLFTVFFAAAVLAAGEKGKPVVVFFNSLITAFFRMLSYFMQFSPLGVLSLMASSMAQHGGSVLSSMAVYILCCYLCCIISFVLVMVIPTCLYTKIPLKKLLTGCGKIALVALSTASSAATLPTTIKVCNEELGADEGVGGFVLPLGCTINMCGGACSFCCLAVFTANAYSLSLSLPTVLLMAGAAVLLNMAAPGIPGGGVVLGTTFLSMFGFPIDIMALESGFYRLLDMAFTTINVEGDVAADLILSKNLEKEI